MKFFCFISKSTQKNISCYERMIYLMKNAYPIVMTTGEKFIVVFIPDFNINTQGNDFGNVGAY